MGGTFSPCPDGTAGTRGELGFLLCPLAPSRPFSFLSKSIYQPIYLLPPWYSLETCCILADRHPLHTMPVTSVGDCIFTQVFSQTPKTSVPWTALLQWRFPSKPPQPHSHGSTSPGIPPEPPIQAPWSLNSISQPPCPSPQCYCPDYGVYPFSVKIHGFYQLFTYSHALLSCLQIPLSTFIFTSLNTCLPLWYLLGNVAVLVESKSLPTSSPYLLR